MPDTLVRSLFLAAMQLAAFAPLSAYAADVLYRSEVHHFSFTVPPQWKAIPRSELNKVEKTGESYGATVRYEAGFRQRAAGGRAPAYFLVQSLPLSGVSPQKYVNLMSKAAQEALDSHPELRSLAQPGAMQFDSTRNIVTMPIATGDQSLRGVMVAFPGRETFTQITFYSPAAKFEKNAPTLDALIASFSYDEGYGYEPSLAQRSGIRWPHILGSVAVITIAASMGFFDVAKRK